MGNIFVVAACTAGKGRQGRFIRGQTSNHENHEYFAPRKLHAIRYLSRDILVTLHPHKHINIAESGKCCCGAKACKASFLDLLFPRLMHIHSIGENLVWNDIRNSMCHVTGTSALDIEMQEL